MSSRWDPEPDEVRDARPYDYESAKRTIAKQSREQTAAEQAIRDASKNHAEAERVYRIALAIKITEVHADGAAWTVAQDLARGDENVAQLRYERDVAAGVREAASQAMWKLAANRRELEQLINWSMRVAPDGQQQDPAEPAQPIGARRAA